MNKIIYYITLFAILLLPYDLLSKNKMFNKNNMQTAIKKIIASQLANNNIIVKLDRFNTIIFANNHPLQTSGNCKIKKNYFNCSVNLQVGKKNKYIDVTGTFKELVYTPVAKTIIPANSLLSNENIDKILVYKNKITDNIIKHKQDVINKITLNTLYPGELIYKKNIGKTITIKKNTQITGKVRSQNIQITIPVTAMTHASINETIPLKYKDRIIHGKVINDNEVIIVKQ